MSETKETYTFLEVRELLRQQDIKAEQLQERVAVLEAALVRLGNMTRFIEQPKRYMHEWYKEDYLEEIRMRNQYAQTALKQEDKT